MTTFQTIVTGVFVLCIIVGVGVFAAFGGLLGNSTVGPVTIWGTIPGEQMTTIIESMASVDSSFQDVKYVEKDAGTYQNELVSAMASGAAPDLFLVAQSDMGSFADKVQLIPYNVVSQSTFTSSFIDEGQLFLTSQGSLALPFTVDPLVMYWNRDLYASAALSNPPQFWNEFITLAPKITKLDASQTVLQSAVALGQWSNVANAKQILSTLFIQSGDNIVVRNQSGSLYPVLGQTPAGAASAPAESALRFYTEFANPSKTTYSWNKALAFSSDAFVGGTLATYFGFASEYKGITERNPNLHFSVSVVPQLQANGAKITYGNMVGIAIPRSARNPAGAATIAQKITSQTGIGVATRILGLPPVRRDVAVDTSGSAVTATFVQSALISRGWLDPNSAATDTLFKNMVESVLSGKQEPAGAVSEAAQELVSLLGNN